MISRASKNVKTMLMYQATAAAAPCSMASRSVSAQLTNVNSET